MLGCKRILKVSCGGIANMPLGNLSNQISQYFKPSHVSAVGNLLGYSTEIGNSTRSYIRNFWEKGTAKPVAGHLHHGKKLDGYNKNLYIKVWGGVRNSNSSQGWRPSEFRRQKNMWETKMQYKTGREFIMWNMIRGKRKYAEFF